MEPEDLVDILNEAIAPTGASLEDVIKAVALLVEKDKANYITSCEQGHREIHKVVIACLDSSIESLRQAAFDYYASTK